LALAFAMAAFGTFAGNGNSLSAATRIGSRQIASETDSPIAASASIA
jgi:hypothetical protein